jgi:L-ribulokinase
MASYTIGLDYGTNSVRAIVVDTADGTICGSQVYAYSHGDMGVIGDVQGSECRPTTPSRLS